MSLIVRKSNVNSNATYTHEWSRPFVINNTFVSPCIPLHYVLFTIFWKKSFFTSQYSECAIAPFNSLPYCYLNVVCYDYTGFTSPPPSPPTRVPGTLENRFHYSIPIFSIKSSFLFRWTFLPNLTRILYAVSVNKCNCCRISSHVLNPLRIICTAIIVKWKNYKKNPYSLNIEINIWNSKVKCNVQAP